MEALYQLSYRGMYIRSRITALLLTGVHAGAIAVGNNSKDYSVKTSISRAPPSAQYAVYEGRSYIHDAS